MTTVDALLFVFAVTFVVSLLGVWQAHAAVCQRRYDNLESETLRCLNDLDVVTANLDVIQVRVGALEGDVRSSRETKIPNVDKRKWPERLSAWLRSRS